MKNKIKKIVTIALAGTMVICIRSGVFAQDVKGSWYIPDKPLPGYEIDVTEYDTLEYNGTEPQGRVAKLLSSGVTRYINHDTGNYYAKGATLVVESTTGKNVKHTTTVTLEKKSLFGGTTVLVKGSSTGSGEIWATTPETPTKGEAHVYWKEA